MFMLILFGIINVHVFPLFVPDTSVTFWGLSYIIDDDGVSYIFGGKGLS